MAISVGDLLMKLGIDDSAFQSALNNAAQLTKDSSDSMQTTLRALGAAFTAVGGTGLAMVESARSMNASLAQTAITTGVSTQTMKNLALSISDVGFPLKDVTDTLQLLSQAGVTNTTDMAEAAKAFDLLGEATGASADTVANELIPAFKAFGIPIADANSYIDQFTYLTKNSTVSLSDFSSAMAWVAEKGSNLGISVTDMTAALMALSEKGVQGTVAVRDFRTAISSAVSTGSDWVTNLGLTHDELNKYADQLQTTTGLTAQYATAAKEQYGLMDNLKQIWAELTLKMSGFLQPLEPILAGMTALGPIMIFLSTSTGAAVLSTISHTIALTGESIALIASETAANGLTGAITALDIAMDANPVGMLLLAVTALAAGFGIYEAVSHKAKSSTDDLTTSVKNYVPPATDAQKATADWVQTLQDLNDINNKVADNDSRLAQITSKLGDANVNLTGSTATLEAATTAVSGKIVASTDSIDGYHWAADGATAANNAYCDVLLKKTKLTQSDIDWLNDYEQAVNKANAADKERQATLQAEVDAANAQVAATAAEVQTALDDEMSAQTTYHNQILSNLQDEYNKTIQTIDDEVAATVQGYNDEIDANNAQIKALDAAEKARQNAKKEATLESEIATATDATTKAGYNAQLDDIIEQSGDSTAQAKRAMDLQALADAATDADTKAQYIQELSDFTVETDYYTQKATLQNDNTTIQSQISLANAKATADKAAAQDAYNNQVNLENSEYANFQAMIANEKTALDTSLSDAQKRYNTDLANFQALCANKLTTTQQMVDAYNALMAEMMVSAPFTSPATTPPAGGTSTGTSAGTTGSTMGTPGTTLPTTDTTIPSGTNGGGFTVTYDEHGNRIVTPYTPTTLVQTFATGGVVKAKPGGQHIIAGEAGEDEVITPISQLKALFNSLTSGLSLDGLKPALLGAGTGNIGSSVNNYNSQQQGGDTYNIDMSGTIVREEADIDKIASAIVSKIRGKTGSRI